MFPIYSLVDRFGNRYKVLVKGGHDLPKGIKPLEFESHERAEAFLLTLRVADEFWLLLVRQLSGPASVNGGSRSVQIKAVARAVYQRQIRILAASTPRLPDYQAYKCTVMGPDGRSYGFVSAYDMVGRKGGKPRQFSGLDEIYAFLEWLLPSDQQLHELLLAIPGLSLPEALQETARAGLMSLLAQAVHQEQLALVQVNLGVKSTQGTSGLTIDTSQNQPVALAPVTRQNPSSATKVPPIQPLRSFVSSCLDSDASAVLAMHRANGAAVTPVAGSEKLFRVKQANGAESFLILDSAVPDFLRPVPIDEKISSLAETRPIFSDREAGDLGTIDAAISATLAIDLSDHKIAGSHYLQELSQVLGDAFKAPAKIEQIALTSELQQEVGLRLVESVSVHEAALSAAGITSREYSQSLVQVMHNPTLSHSQRVEQLAQLVTDLEARSGVQLDDAHEFIAHLPEEFSEPQLLLGDDGMVYQGGEATGSMADMIRDVHKTNQVYAANGVNREVVVAVTSQNKVMLLSRKTQVSTITNLPPKLPEQGGDPLSGQFTVEIGAGSGAYSPNMVADLDRLSAPLIQTEFGPKLLEPGLGRRDLQGWATQVGMDSDADTVIVLADALALMPQLFGEKSTKKLIMNNISADPTSEDYDKMAESLLSVMADGGEIDLQWDIKPEDDADTPRGHIMLDKGVTKAAFEAQLKGKNTNGEGQSPAAFETKGLKNALIEEADKRNMKVEFQVEEPITQFPYSIDVSRRTTGPVPDDSDKYTDPKPSSRSTIKVKH